MRDCLRNQRKIWYSLYLGKAPVLENGLETGQSKEVHSDPVEVWVTLTSPTGGSEAELFGASVQYDRVISTVQDLPIDEYSRLWIDCDPATGAQFDYKVKRAAPGLNQNLWAIEKVVRNGR